MLQALVKHYDIGRNPYHKDFVGVLSSHPFTICAVLRVFGRGIEALPSRQDWEHQREPLRKTHSPLRPAECAPMMQASPVDYVRTAKIHPTLLVADTKFFVDHAVPDEAVRRITYAMNKQLHEPWQWPFGSLPEGHEYLCLLEYHFDPEYAMRPRFCEQLAVRTTPARYRAMATPNSSQPSVDYVQVNEYLVQDMEGNSTQSNSSSSVAERIAKSENKSLAKRVLGALDVLTESRNSIVHTMDGKRVPSCIARMYSMMFWNGSELLRLPSLDRNVTWREMKDWAEKLSEGDRKVQIRLLILQTLQFEELSEECKILRKDVEDRKKRNERIEQQRQKRNAGKRIEKQSKLPKISLGAWQDAMGKHDDESPGCLPFVKFPSLPRAFAQATKSKTGPKPPAFEHG